jgi:subtilisin family serine protease
MAKLQTAIARTRDCLHRGVLSGLFLVLTACGGSGAGSAAPPAPPIATASASVSQGQAPLTVNFDASKSTDPQNYPLTYSWAFSDGTTATGATAAHAFQNHGSYTATVAVNDGHNTTTSAPIAISVSPAPPTVQPLTVQVNVMGVAATAVPAQLVASDRESLALTYTLTTPPTVGTATVNGSTGAVTYTVPGYVTATTDSFAVTVANLGASSPSTIKVSLNSDPLLANQWHIQNVGQNTFAATLPLAGNDMNVTGAWTAGFSGKGIKVGVVDSGLELAHEDLAANVDGTHSYNFLTGTNDPTRATSDPGFDHGTQVAGIIAAVAFNGKGGRGVAYNAKLRGYNLLAAGAFSAVNMAKALGSDPISSDNDVFNASFGATLQGLPTFSGAFQAISATTLTLRGGLGATISNAAGNDFADWEANPKTGLCQYANTFGVSCGDPANDERRGGYTPIIVGAVNANGTHSSYSSTGSSLWISAPGGEFGLDSSFFPGLADPNDYKPAITTAARTGCANAPYVPNLANALDAQGANVLAANCQYTATMNGTSSATPNVAGAIALMLEANAKLSVRDIKYILAKTAKKVDSAFPGVSSTSIVPGATVVLEQGWTTNSAGWSFSNRYGFGAVDAAAAVTMAKSYTTYLPALQSSTGTYQFTAAPPATIPPQSASGAFLAYSVSEAFSSVESVIVFLNIASTPGMQCNQVELKSPAGTKSILIHGANGFSNAAVNNARILSNAFYGEPVNGTWTLTFYDFCAASGTSTQLSTTAPQTLLIVGH